MNALKNTKSGTVVAWVTGLALVAVLAVIAAVAIHRGGSAPTRVIHTSGPVPEPPSGTRNPLLTDPHLMDVLAAAPGSAAYARIVAAQGVQTSVIHVQNCRPYPEVAAVAAGQSVTITNVDATARALKGPPGSGFSLSLAPHASKTFTPSASGPASFTYTCDGAAAGAITVIGRP